MALGDWLITVLWFLFFMIPVFLAVWVIIDALRSDDLSGWARGTWVFVVLVIPILGSLAYIVMRGHKHHERAAQAQVQQERSARQYAAGGSVAEELTKLAKLHEDGVLDEAEFNAEKTKLIG